MTSVSVWLRAMRVQFLQASIVPVVVGSALAFRDGVFFWDLFWLTAAAIGAINIGTNLANDYYDHLSGADARNLHATPFSGGSRVIQERRLAPKAVLRASLIAYAVGILLGTVLLARAGRGLLAFGLPGVVLAFFYTAPPLKLGYRGWGELLVGLLLGPVAVLGTYYVYAGTVSAEALAASLPVGFLVAAILYINQFPDAESDAAAGKRHWIARLGKRRAVAGYVLILAAAYGSILVSTAIGILPGGALLALAGLPPAVWAARILRRSYDQTEGLIPAMGLTIGAHLATGLLLAAGLLVDP